MDGLTSISCDGARGERVLVRLDVVHIILDAIPDHDIALHDHRHGDRRAFDGRGDHDGGGPARDARGSAGPIERGRAPRRRDFRRSPDTLAVLRAMLRGADESPNGAAQTIEVLIELGVFPPWEIEQASIVDDRGSWIVKVAGEPVAYVDPVRGGVVSIAESAFVAAGERLMGVSEDMVVEELIAGLAEAPIPRSEGALGSLISPFYDRLREAQEVGDITYIASRVRAAGESPLSFASAARHNAERATEADLLAMSFHDALLPLILRELYSPDQIASLTDAEIVGVSLAASIHVVPVLTAEPSWLYQSGGGMWLDSSALILRHHEGEWYIWEHSIFIQTSTVYPSVAAVDPGDVHGKILAALGDLFGREVSMDVFAGVDR